MNATASPATPWATGDAANVTITNLLQQDSGRNWDFYGD